MSIEIITKLVLLLLFIIFSAFFSGSETAVFSMTILEKEKLKRKSRGRLGRFIQLVTEQPDDLLITILTGNMIVNMFATALYDNLIQNQILFENKTLAFLFPILSMTVILLLFGELMPKRLALLNPDRYVRCAGIPLFLISALLAPLRIVLGGMRRLLMVKIVMKENERDLIRATIKIGHKERIINELEYRLFDSFFSFNNLVAEDIMLPRTEISGVEISTPLPDVLRHCEKVEHDTAHSLLLVFKEDIDNPLGYVELKDLVPFQFHVNEEPGFERIIRPCHFVPESKRLNQLLREMKELNMGMAVIFDEYGGTAGLITFNHLVESILSYFYSSDEDRIKAISRNAFEIPGDLEIKTLEEMLHLRFTTEARTVGGLVLETLGEIPVEGEKLKVGAMLFTILKMQKNRIDTLKIEVDA